MPRPVISSTVSPDVLFIEDGSPTLQAFLADTSPEVDETVGTAQFEIALTEISSTDVTVRWISEDGSALMGLDYGGLDVNTVIPAGELSVLIDVPIVDDEEVEADETIMRSTVVSQRSENRFAVHGPGDNRRQRTAESPICRGFAAHRGESRRG